MTRLEAEDYAVDISKTYGRTIIFREGGKRESYQAIASSSVADDFELGCIAVGVFIDGRSQVRRAA